MKTTVIFHSGDYDGIFSREIARKFLPDAELIGWDFVDKPLIERLPMDESPIYVIDLPVDRSIFGADFKDIAGPLLQTILKRVIWIDHHKSSIDTHPKDIPGYRIDGVAACRLAWQWFIRHSNGQNDDVMPLKEFYIERRLTEPLAVRLAGEYDVWDHRDNDADIAFQFGLDSMTSPPWDLLLSFGLQAGKAIDAETYVESIVNDGAAAMRCYAKRDADVMRTRSFLADFEGLRFLCLNTPRCNSQTFAARDVKETGHDALLAFFWNGEFWNVSLYHAAHRKDLDLSEIAKKWKGGGHRGACGFRASSLPFLP